MQNNKGTPVNLVRVGNLVSEGSHVARLVDWEERQGPNGIYWNYKLEIEERSDDNGKPLWLIVSLAPKARWKLEQFLDAVAAPTEGIAHGSDFIGRLIRVEVIHESYEGRMQARINRVYPVTTETAQPVTSSPFDLRSLTKSVKFESEEKSVPGEPEILQQMTLDAVAGLPSDIVEEDDEE